MSLALRNSKKRRIHKRIFRTRKTITYSRTYSRTRIMRQKGGASVNHNPEINVSYDNGKIQVVNGQDLTNEWNNEQLKAQPDINIPNAISVKTYLITMTDPDAPNGQGASGNHIWTHYVITMKNGNIEKVIVPYQQPSPPHGIHRYEIKVYDASMITQLPPIIKGNGDNERSNYYTSHLEVLSNITPIGKVMYKVMAIIPPNRTGFKTRKIY